MVAAQNPPDVIGALRQLSLSLERWRTMFARRHGLVENDAIVMSYLANNDDRLLPREIAHFMDLRTGTVTTMLDRLERAGFVARTPNPDDRRSTFVDLTELGRTRMSEHHAAFDARLLAAISPEARADFVRHVEAVSRTVHQVVDFDLR